MPPLRSDQRTVPCRRATRPVEVSHRSRVRVPYVPRDASLLDVVGDHPNTWSLYDCTDVLGGFTSYVGLPANIFWEREFAPVVQLLAPVVRHVTQSDFFYNALSAMPTGTKLHPRKWVSCASYPPCYDASKKIMGRFGFRVPCDHKEHSGCDEWLEIYREYKLFPEAAVYSVAMSNGVHRLACNHCFARPTDRSALGVWVPSLHPAIELFMRLKVRECAEGGHPRLTMTRMLPMLTKHLRTSTFLHCGRRLPEEGESRDTATKKGACRHPFTYDVLSQQESGYFSGASVMPPWVNREEIKRDGKGAAKATMRRFTTDVPVTIHHMISRRGDCSNGRAIYETRQKEKIADKLLRLNATFMREMDAPQLESLRPADNTMPAAHSLFEKGNLFTTWTRYVNDIDNNKPSNFDVYQWRLIGMLYRKKSQAEMRTGAKTGASRDENGAITPLTVDDFQPPPHHNSTRRNEREYEMVVVLGSVASLFTGLMAWACRKVTHGVVLGMDHMYNMLKGVANVRHPSNALHLPETDTAHACFLSSVLFVYCRGHMREGNTPPDGRCFANRSRSASQRSRRVGVAPCGRVAPSQRIRRREVHAACRCAPQHTAGARLAGSVFHRFGPGRCVAGSGVEATTGIVGRHGTCLSAGEVSGV